MAIGSLVAVPDLQSDGPARLVTQQQGYLGISFLETGAEMTQEARRVVRYCLFPGTRVRGVSGMEADATLTSEESYEEYTIGAAAPQQLHGGIIAYPTTKAGEFITERGIAKLIPTEDPVEQLATVQFHDTRQRFARAGTPMPPDAWGPNSFCARESLLRFSEELWMQSEAVPGVVGARIEILPHQLMVARRVLSDQHVRFLLADEVGLGKTIEAGLIMQSLLSMRPNLRVLVVAPGALVSQWFVELYVKFGGRRFLMLDEQRLASYDGCAWDEQFIIASARCIESLSGKAAIQFAQKRWDLVIVDECHRMQPGGALAKRISILSRRSPHVLLLSATPGRHHSDAFLNLLALLNPDAYDGADLKTFESKLALHDQVQALLHRSESGEEDVLTLANDWRELLGTDAAIENFCARLENQDEEAVQDLCGYISENYHLDHRIIANKRVVLQRLARESGARALALATRSCVHKAYAPSPAELELRLALAAYREVLIKKHAPDSVVPPRLAHWLLQLEQAAWLMPSVLARLLAMRSTILADPEDFEEYRIQALPNEQIGQVLRSDFSEAERSTHVAISACCFAEAKSELGVLQDLDTACAKWRDEKKFARFECLLATLEEFWEENPQEKVIVFVNNSLAVEPLAEFLESKLGSKAIEQFGAHQEQVEREEAAGRFADRDSITVLVSDPLGGEGRNFQFVSMIVHFDLPWSIAATEQRVGRVDRIGRDGDVPSVLIYADNTQSPKKRKTKKTADLPEFVGLDAAWARVLDTSVTVFNRSSSGLEFISGGIESEALEAALRHGAGSCEELIPEFAQRVQEDFQAREDDQDHIYQAQCDAFSALAEKSAAIHDIRAPAGAAANWLRGMGGQAKRDEETGVWSLRARHADDYLQGVFGRDQALQKQEYAFLSPGHDIVDRLIENAAAATWCRANAWRRKPEGMDRWDGVRVSYSLQLDFTPLMQANLSLETLRRLFAVVPLKRPVEFFRLDTGERDEDSVLRTNLQKPYDARRGDTCLSPRTSREFWMRPLLGGKHDQIIGWQQQIRKAGEHIAVYAKEMWQREFPAAEAALDESLSAELTIKRAQRDSTLERLGRGHADSQRLIEETTELETSHAALRACLAGATMRPDAAAYVVLA